MVEFLTKYYPEIEQACFDLLNRKHELIDPDTFCSKFKEGIKNGEVYIERENNKIVSYLRGCFREVKGFPYFELKEIASIKNYLNFCREARKIANESVRHVFYYRKKSNSVYFVQFTKDDRMKFKKVWEGGKICLESIRSLFKDQKSIA